MGVVGVGSWTFPVGPVWVPGPVVDDREVEEETVTVRGKTTRSRTKSGDVPSLPLPEETLLDPSVRDGRGPGGV